MLRGYVCRTATLQLDRLVDLPDAATADCGNRDCFCDPRRTPYILTQTPYCLRADSFSDHDN
jgi:hypothetical protein